MQRAPVSYIVRFCAMYAKSRSPYAVTRSMSLILSLYFFSSSRTLHSSLGGVRIRCIALFYSTLFQEKQYSLRVSCGATFYPKPSSHFWGVGYIMLDGDFFFLDSRPHWTFWRIARCLAVRLPSYCFVFGVITSIYAGKNEFSAFQKISNWKVYTEGVYRS